MTLDSSADIILDADGADIVFKDGGTTIATHSNSSSDYVITTGVQDKDFVIKGDDGGSAITPLTIDMSAGGDLFLTGGLIDLKNNGSNVSQIKFYCESSNAHAQTLIGAPHSESATNTLTLPSTGGNSYLLTAASTATLTNKTLTAPVINTATVGTSITPASDDGATLGSANLNWSDLFLADGAEIKFGDDQDLSIKWLNDGALEIKRNSTSDDTYPRLTLSTGDTDIAANDLLGAIDFKAPDEGAGTDAILVAAGIEAVSEGDFSASNNATKLQFRTAASGAATTKMTIASDGDVGIGTESPAHPFHVLAGSAGQTVAKFESNEAGAVAVEIDADADRDSFLRFQEAGTTRWDLFAQGSSGTNELNIREDGGNNVIRMTQDGYVTMPLQPAFNVNLSADQTDLAINGRRTIEFDTERFDVNADFNTGNYTFTAPVTGKYQLNFSAQLSDFDGSSNFVGFHIETSNDIYMYYHHIGGSANANADGSGGGALSCLADMDANDTAFCSIYQHAGAAQLNVVYTGTSFNGILIG